MSKTLCCECIWWEMGEYWQSNPSKKNNVPVVISEGWCVSPERKKPKRKWSHCPACKYLEKAPRNSIIFCGEGDITAEILDKIIVETKKFLEE